MRVEALEAPGGEARGARVTDLLTGASGTVRAALVVNACGPWSDAIRRLEDPAAAPILRLTKGAHVIVPRRRLGHHEAITLTSPLDGRVMFVLPWGELSYIGTTDTDTAESPDEVRASVDDILYLLRSANAYFPNAHLNEADVLASWAGLRPLLAQAEAVGASHVSREHRIVRGPLGMLTIAGGKLTTYRSMAAELVDVGVRELQKSGRGGGTARSAAATDREALPGGEALDLEPFRQPGLDLGLAPETVEHLLRHYGTEAAAVYNLIRQNRGLLVPIVPGHPAVEAEVVHVTRRELAQRVEDVMMRRLHLYYEAPDHGAEAVTKVARLMGGELGWSEERKAEEEERYLEMTGAR
jgi:glycerol-3-phosphate dehydrogenase